MESDIVMKVNTTAVAIKAFFHLSTSALQSLVSSWLQSQLLISGVSLGSGALHCVLQTERNREAYSYTISPYNDT